MADDFGTMVSQLPLGENLADDDLMYAVEGGVSKKVEVGYLKEVFGSGADNIKIGYIEDKITQLQSFDVRDIFTLDNSVEGYYIQSANGNPSANANTGHTDYIDVSSFAEKITCSLLASTLGNAYQGAFYDKDKVFISGIEKTNITTDIDYDFAIPLNAKYLRFSFYLDKKNDYYINATTKISKNSISDSDIFTTYGATLNHYCSGSSGAILPTNGVACTNYIDVSNFNFITTPNPNAQTHQGAFFDDEYNYISGYSQSGTGNITLSVPSNAKYIIISYVMSLESSYYIKGTIPIDNIVNNVMNNPYTYKNYSTFKINCLGDSITYGYTPDSGTQMKAPFPAQIRSLLGAYNCRNYGISGSTLAVNSGNYDPMCTRYTDMDNDADIVILFGGTNDYGRAVYTPTLGTISDAVNTTVYGALNILAAGLIEKYPKAFIFFITPLRRADKTGDNDGGYSLEDVATAIKEVGHKYSIPVLDLYSNGGFHIDNSTFRGYYGGNDKLHPNQAFVTEHLAPMIARFIQSNI